MAFGLIVRRRLGHKAIGFASERTADSLSETKGQLLSEVIPEDLTEYGMIPEMIGRLPIITSLQSLSEQTLVRILTEPKNALIRQYQHFFMLENTQLEFTPGALSAIARRAMERETGARALRSVMEEIMLDLMYDLPDAVDKRAKYIIDADAVHQRKSLIELRVARKESA